MYDKKELVAHFSEGQDSQRVDLLVKAIEEPSGYLDRIEDCTILMMNNRRVKYAQEGKEPQEVLFAGYSLGPDSHPLGLLYAVVEAQSKEILWVREEVGLVTQEVERIVYKPIRKRLPDERPSITHKFSIAGHEGYLHIGLYPDTHMPGEIFITMSKLGSTISGLMDAFATSISIALQYGVPVEDLCNKFSHMRFEPSGFTNNKQIPIAKSIMDYIFRYFSLKFLSSQSTDAGEESEEGEEDASDPLVPKLVEGFMRGVNGADQLSLDDEAQKCKNCGSIMVQSGSCYSCPNCGSTQGCDE